MRKCYQLMREGGSFVIGFRLASHLYDVACKNWNQSHSTRGPSLEEVGFDFQQSGALSSRRPFQRASKWPLLRSHFKAPADSKAHPTLRNNHYIRRNRDAPIVDHQNKWESVASMDHGKVTGVRAIPYTGYGFILTLDPRRESVPHHHCKLNRVHLPRLHQDAFQFAQKDKLVEILQAYLLYLLIYVQDGFKGLLLHACSKLQFQQSYENP